MVSFFDRLFRDDDKKTSSQDLAPIEYKNEGATNKNQKKIRMSVTGRVQGVGFRYMTKQAADNIPVTGKVRNESDGSVYIEAIGTEKQITQFVQEIRKSPSPSARIEKVTVEEDATIEDSSNFSVSN